MVDKDETIKEAGRRLADLLSHISPYYDKQRFRKDRREALNEWEAAIAENKK